MNKGLLTVLVLLQLLPLIASVQQAVDKPGSLEISRFSSYEELKRFV